MTKHPYRLVRIDHKTVIEVKDDVTDDEAIARFHERQEYKDDPNNRRRTNEFRQKP